VIVYGFYQLAQQLSQYKEAVEQFFAMAMRDEASSVKRELVIFWWRKTVNKSLPIRFSMLLAYR